MSDDFYRKQLEDFGIESNRIIRGDIEKKRQEERRESTVAILKMIMDRIEGRQWVYSMLDTCRVFTAPFAPGKPDVSLFLTGMQAVGQLLLNDIMLASPQHFQTMISEEAARREVIAEKQPDQD